MQTLPLLFWEHGGGLGGCQPLSTRDYFGASSLSSRARLCMCIREEACEVWQRWKWHVLARYHYMKYVASGPQVYSRFPLILIGSIMNLSQGERLEASHPRPSPAALVGSAPGMRGAPRRPGGWQRCAGMYSTHPEAV